MAIFRNFALLAILVGTAVFGQSIGNGSLNGKFFARHLMLSLSTNGAITEARTFYGSLTFDGAGSFAYSGTQLVGGASPAPMSGSGTYSIKATGLMTLSNFQRTDSSMIRAGLGQGALVGSTTETAGVYDMFVAVPAPTSGVLNNVLNGSYWTSTLEFPGGTAANMKNAFFKLVANGAGGFSDVTVSGKAANLQDKLTNQIVAAPSYSVSPDGSGTANFPLLQTFTMFTQLLGGTRQIFVSSDSSVVVGGSNIAGGHDMMIATKTFTGTAANTNLRNLYFAGGLRMEPNRPGSFAGSANANGTGKLSASRRVRQLEGVLDFTGASNYVVSADGTGTVETNRFAIGPNGTNYTVNGLAVTDSNNYEIGFGIRATAASSVGTFFINSQGIVNAASFAPVGAPVSPGAFLSIFGSGFTTSTTVATTAPFPVTLSGVQVLVNNTPAPLYFVSPGQISCLVPFGVTGTTATFVVTNAGNRTNSVEVPLAKSSPGIFTLPSAGTGLGAVLKADYSVVSTANPAKRGDIVQIFLTGLGATAPVVADGALAPSSPLSIVPGTVAVYIGGRAAEVLFKGLAPGLVGLYQMNVKVPASAPIGNVSLAVDTGDSFHDMVDLVVSQ